LNPSVASFAKSTLKIAAALFLAFCALGIVVATYAWFEEAAEERKAKPFA
jgi:hypothetical protein